MKSIGKKINDSESYTNVVGHDGVQRDMNFVEIPIFKKDVKHNDLLITPSTHLVATWLAVGKYKFLFAKQTEIL